MFRHGFKKEAEEIALELREELKLGLQTRLNPAELAEHLHVPVRSLRDFELSARESVRHLLGQGKSAFSAATIYVSRFKRIVIANPAHPLTRQGNSLCHELSHILLNHEGEAPINLNGGRAWNGAQEREADWLAGCLLIPKDAAHTAARKGQTDQEVAEQFGVSLDLATWRMNITGARIRAKRLARFGFANVQSVGQRGIRRSS